MSKMIQLPEEFQGLLQPMQGVLTVGQQWMAKMGGGRSIDYGQVEREVAAAVARLERAVHQTLLQRLDIDCARVLIKGHPHVRVGRYPATYYTMAGPVQVERSLYREQGEPTSKTVDTVSLRAGVVEDGWLPETAAAMAYLMQQGTSREAAATAESQGRLPYSRCSFDRVSHAVGEHYVQNNIHVEQELIEAYQVPAKASGVSVSVDRVSIPMEEPNPHPPPRPAEQKPKKEIQRCYRMAYCGTVTVHDQNGEALHTIRYGRMPQGDAVGLLEGLSSDVDMMRIKRPDLKVTLLCDGAKELWDLMDEQLNSKTLHTDVVRLVDMWHLVEKLGAAAALMFGAAAEREVARWKLLLLNNSQAAEQIRDELLLSPKRRVRVGDGRPVQDAITYLQNHANQMDYATARKQGRPIGSGGVEATCKSLVSLRMKRPGSRWKEPTGEHIIQLRALGLSDRWTQAMHLTLAPLRVPIERAA
jgi:hypothetical protein